MGTSSHSLSKSDATLKTTRKRDHVGRSSRLLQCALGASSAGAKQRAIWRWIQPRLQPRRIHAAASSVWHEQLRSTRLRSDGSKDWIRPGFQDREAEMERLVGRAVVYCDDGRVRRGQRYCDSRILCDIWIQRRRYL